MTEREDRFLELVRENEARLRRICRIYGRGDAERDDLYQDVLVQLWRALPTFRGDSLAGTWVYRVALNTALARRRDPRLRRETPLVAAHELRPDGRPGPEERLETAQRRERLHAAIDRLGDLDKALVALYLEERSYAEMAEILGMSESNVGVKLHRIRKRLADWLAEAA